MRSFVHTVDNSAASTCASRADSHAKTHMGSQTSRKNLHGAAALTATQKTAARGRSPSTPAAAASLMAAPATESAKESDNMAPGRRVVERSVSSSSEASSEPITPLTVEALTEHNLRTTPKLLRTDNGVLLEIATWCAAPELLVLSGVSSRFRGTIHAHDSFLWRGLCESLWRGRYLSTPQLMPYLNALNSPSASNHHHQVASPVAPTAVASPSATTSSGGPEFPAMPQHHKPASSHKIATWREAFVRSIAQSKKTRLTAEELHASQWQISFLVDDSIPSQAITFNTQTGVVRTEGFDPMRYQLYQQGGQLHVHVFPTQTVTRDEETWQWILHNPFVEIRNVSTTPTAAGTPNTLPQALPELRPWFRVVSPSSHGGDRLFSSCRDTELCDPQSDSHSSERCSSEEVDPELPLFTGSKRKQRREREKFKRQTYTCELGDDLPFTFVGQAPKFQQDATHDGFLPGTKVAGHGGGCDGEDPPPFTDTGDPASKPACSGASDEDSESESDSGAAAGRTNQGKGNTGGNSWRKNTQQKCASVLSQSTVSFFEKMFSQEEALWEQMGDLHSSQQRALWSHCPSIVECHESEHLLDPGRPRRPP